jgi:DNA-directed RNA polymerase sigma subunit (sigma70/sigma32)|tara:strand:+ start:2066 stop:2245 length:180 start_codon:yes stop_codon:yes gene_type:complete
MERDEEILRLWKEELMTLSAIGKKYGLTRERVRQIVAKQRAKNVSDIRTAGNGKNDDAS